MYQKDMGTKKMYLYICKNEYTCRATLHVTGAAVQASLGYDPLPPISTFGLTPLQTENPSLKERTADMGVEEMYQELEQTIAGLKVKIQLFRRICIMK